MKNIKRPHGGNPSQRLGRPHGGNPSQRLGRPRAHRAPLKPIRDMGLIEGTRVLHARFKARNWWLDADTAVNLAMVAGAGRSVGKRGVK